MKRRAVVTGIGVVTSLSCQVDDLWQRIVAGESGIHPLRLFDASPFKVRIGGDIYDWNPGEYISAKNVKRVDRFSQFALVAGTDAVTDAGIDFSREKPFRCGVVLGCGVGGLSEIETQVGRLLKRGPERVSALTVPKMMLNAAGGNLSIKYGLRGTNYTVATACASAGNAIGDALKAIRYDDADVMITGGTEAALTPVGLSSFQNMRALSERNDTPPAASRPFDRDRDGFVLSEGAGLLVVEEVGHARARGARIYCELLGFGASGDAGHLAQPDGQGVGAAKAMSLALTDARINADEVDYINAHGTGTLLGDRAETRAMKTVFGEHARKVGISSTKSHLGHSLGASGGIELVLGVQALRHDLVPPTINLENPDPECDLDYTPEQPRERSIRVVMSNSFGFGGHNASVIIGSLRNGQV